MDLEVGQILRKPSEAAQRSYDAIIIGGGIYGATLALEAARRSLNTLLLERDDFGAHTSSNSLRIIHGGLRYLQNIDLWRFYESVGERAWFLKMFPSLVQILPCLMPLYGIGLRRPSIFQVALKINDFLLNIIAPNGAENRFFPKGEIVSAESTKKFFPTVRLCGLQGAAIWYDACVPDSQRLIIEILCWACDSGTTAMNYFEVKKLLKSGNKVTGVLAIDRESGNLKEFHSPIVINAAGPWNRDLASIFHRDEPALFIPSLAWNVLLDRPAPSDYALALAPKQRGGQIYFFLPWQGKLLAGTGHAPWKNYQKEHPRPTEEQLQGFIHDLNSAMPDLNIDSSAIIRIFAGLLPASHTGTSNLTKREVIYDHGSNGGPKGLFSVTGIKFTTARRVAEKVMHKVFPTSRPTIDYGSSPFVPTIGESRQISIDAAALLSNNERKERTSLKAMIEKESVLHLTDLILRRTTLWADPIKAVEIAPVIAQFFNWDSSRKQQEIEKLKQDFLCNGFEYMPALHSTLAG